MDKIANRTRSRRSRRTSGDAAPPPSHESSPNLPMPHVPGPTGSNAANVMIADIVVRMGTAVLRKGVERAFFRRTVGRQDALRIEQKRSLPQKAATIALARIGTASLPGAAVVGLGLVAITVYQRRRAERFEQAMGKLKLLGKGEG